MYENEQSSLILRYVRKSRLILVPNDPSFSSQVKCENQAHTTSCTVRHLLYPRNVIRKYLGLLLNSITFYSNSTWCTVCRSMIEVVMVVIADGCTDRASALANGPILDFIPEMALVPVWRVLCTSLLTKGVGREQTLRRLRAFKTVRIVDLYVECWCLLPACSEVSEKEVVGREGCASNFYQSLPRYPTV